MFCMFSYYLALAVRSLRRSPGLTALMILTIGFGVAASMTMYSVFRGLSADPIPWKSSQLFVPQIDAWGPGHGDQGEPPMALTYIDAMALTHQHRAVRQSSIIAMWRSIAPPRASPNGDLIEARGYAVDSEFFPMLDVPFHYGSSWSAGDDDHQAAVAVVSDRFNQKEFGGGNSVGKVITIAGHDYRIVGIIKHWNPQPEFFATFRYQSEEPDFFLPVGFAIANNVVSDTHVDCKDRHSLRTDFAALLRSGCTWLDYMVELDTPAAVRAYRQYLDAYASQQQQLGRFQWKPNNRLRDVPAFLDYVHVVPSTGEHRGFTAGQVPSTQRRDRRAASTWRIAVVDLCPVPYRGRSHWRRRWPHRSDVHGYWRDECRQGDAGEAGRACAQ
jgi:putative ABC transport system permease protein